MGDQITKYDSIQAEADVVGIVGSCRGRQIL